MLGLGDISKFKLFCLQKEITIQNELLSKIKWENALVKYTKIFLPLK